MSKLYKSMFVWKRIEGQEEAIRFSCFEVIGENKYCVQSADHFYLPIDRVQLDSFDDQLVELFIEETPDSRGGVYDTLEEAIRSFETDFSS